MQRFLDRSYEHLSIAQRATATAQVESALAAVPGSTLDSYELPHTSTSAAQVLVDKGAAQFRVYVHPQTLAILKVEALPRMKDSSLAWQINSSAFLQPLAYSCSVLAASSCGDAATLKGFLERH